MESRGGGVWGAWLTLFLLPGESQVWTAPPAPPGTPPRTGPCLSPLLCVADVFSHISTFLVSDVMGAVLWGLWLGGCSLPSPRHPHAPSRGLG